MHPSLHFPHWFTLAKPGNWRSYAVYVQLYVALLSRADSCDHHSNQRTELFHHQELSPAAPSSYPQFWTTTSPPPVFVILRMPDQRDHTHTAIGGWRVWFGIVPFGFIQTDVWINSLFLSIDEQYSTVWKDHSLLTIHLLRDFLGHFQSGVITIKAAVNIRMWDVQRAAPPTLGGTPATRTSD